MRIWLFSDLHLRNGSVDIASVLPIIPDADVCVVPGDLMEARPDDAVRWLEDYVASVMPCIYVAGNHEFYSHFRTMDVNRGLAARAAERTGGLVSFLDDATVNIAGVRFIGSTLWTDFDLFGGGDEVSRAYAMDAAGAYMNDYKYLYEGSTPWTPSLSRKQHLASRAWLEAEMAASTLPTVVVTHHAPHMGSVAVEYERSLLTAAFVSDLTPVIERGKPALWLHGHVHNSFDYRVGSTRVICNPKGYGMENWRRFDPGMVIEIDEYTPEPPGA